MNRNTRAYIRWVQSSLNANLGSRLRVDGIRGPRTHLATRSFQQRAGLPPIGIVGPRTEAALIAAGVWPPT
jgi:peptidoglycan hydrolase-like protein with peptidoglycan-binding domain